MSTTLQIQRRQNLFLSKEWRSCIGHTLHFQAAPSASCTAHVFERLHSAALRLGKARLFEDPGSSVFVLGFLSAVLAHAQRADRSIHTRQRASPTTASHWDIFRDRAHKADRFAADLPNPPSDIDASATSAALRR